MCHNTFGSLSSPGQDFLLVGMKKFATLHIIAGIVLFLLENGADIETRNSQNPTLLHLTAKHGDVGLTQKLLNRGADYDAETVDRASSGHG